MNTQTQRDDTPVETEVVVGKAQVRVQELQRSQPQEPEEERRIRPWALPTLRFLTSSI